MTGSSHLEIYYRKPTLFSPCLFHLVSKTIIYIHRYFVNSFMKIFYPFFKTNIDFFKKKWYTEENPEMTMTIS